MSLGEKRSNTGTASTGRGKKLLKKDDGRKVLGWGERLVGEGGVDPLLHPLSPLEYRR